MPNDAALWISERELAEKIREHGVETYPHECCGALLGRDVGVLKARLTLQEDCGPREVLAAFPLVNRTGRFAAQSFFGYGGRCARQRRERRKSRAGIIGWYHSHPDHPARPSEYDRDHAWPWYSYIIVSVHTEAAAGHDFVAIARTTARIFAEGIEIRQMPKKVSFRKASMARQRIRRQIEWL